jgi:hypothetical protein
MTVIKRITYPNGERVEFTDCIHHSTTTKFPFLQRVKHLFGAPIVVDSKIYTEHEPGWIDASAKGMNTRLFPRKTKGAICMEPKEVK